MRARIALGDRAALGEAFASYRLFARKLCREKGRLERDVDDLVQDSFLLLPQCARRCAPATSLAGCVATAVRQALRGWDCRSATSDQTGLGRGLPTRRVEVTAEELAQVPGAWTPEETLELRERVHHLSELLEQMPSREREVLIAREMGGLTASEVAELFGIKLGSVATTATKARARLMVLAKASPLAELFAAMPRRGLGLGYSRASRWRRRRVVG